MTIHDLDMARFVTGSEVVEVFADRRRARRPGDRRASATSTPRSSSCATPTAALTVIDNSRQCVYGYDQRVEAFGSAGMAASENAPGGNTVRWDAAGGHRPPIPAFFLDRYTESYVDQWEAFVAAVSAGQPPPVTGADGRTALVLGLAARRSMDEGRPVEP